MSIYPVRFKEWFPKGDPMHGCAKSVLPCIKCGKIARFRNAIGHHSLPYGGGGHVWCNQHCFKTDK
jgi:hypothetical protein